MAAKQRDRQSHLVDLLKLKVSGCVVLSSYPIIKSSVFRSMLYVIKDDLW